jgi:hypothetical protein
MGDTPFPEFLRRAGEDISAKYVGFKCADDYYESIDMPTALHSQTLLAFPYDSQQLPARYVTQRSSDFPRNSTTRSHGHHGDLRDQHISGWL